MTHETSANKPSVINVAPVVVGWAVEEEPQRRALKRSVSLEVQFFLKPNQPEIRFLPEQELPDAILLCPSRKQRNAWERFWIPYPDVCHILSSS